MYQDITHIKVNLIKNSYEVLVGSNTIYDIGFQLKQLKYSIGTKILVVTNPDVSKPYSSSFIKSIQNEGYEPRLLTIEAGEDQKTTESIALIHDAAYEHKLERGSLMIALGGGVIGDMVGFAAATWLRGISFIQVPTTLLSMVDASVGGKTGVNHPKGKNLIGAFHQPKLVLIDIDTLNTLPEREFRAGMAEIIKYGVIGDKELFEKLEEAKDLKNLESIDRNFLLEIITKSIKAKAKIVEKDEKENGLRATLNYGHTFGHVVEALSGYGKFLHGEAVSIGMVIAGQLSLQENLWSKAEAKRQNELLIKAGLPIKWPNLDEDLVLRSLRADKKVKDGHIRFILATEIGKVKLVNKIKEDQIYKLLSSLN